MGSDDDATPEVFPQHALIMVEADRVVRSLVFPFCKFGVAPVVDALLAVTAAESRVVADAAATPEKPEETFQTLVKAELILAYAAGELVSESVQFPELLWELTKVSVTVSENPGLAGKMDAAVAAFEQAKKATSPGQMKARASSGPGQMKARASSGGDFWKLNWVNWGALDFHLGDE